MFLSPGLISLPLLRFAPEEERTFKEIFLQIKASIAGKGWRTLLKDVRDYFLICSFTTHDRVLFLEAPKEEIFSLYLSLSSWSKSS